VSLRADLCVRRICGSWIAELNFIRQRDDQILNASIASSSNKIAKMRTITFALVTLAGLAVGQTPVGFTPAVGEHLVVKFGNKVVEEPGTALTKERP
jgi:hypothetical protein